VFSPDGRRVLSSAHDRKLKVWDAQNGALLTTITTGQSWEERPLYCAFSPDGRRVIAWLADMTVKVWDAQNGSHHVTLDQRRPADAPSVHPRDPQRILTLKFIATPSASGTSSGVTYSPRFRARENDCAKRFAPDGRYLLSQGEDGGGNSMICPRPAAPARARPGGAVKWAACLPRRSQVAFLDAQNKPHRFGCRHGERLAGAR
jgi:WD40 repeat protein